MKHLEFSVIEVESETNTSITVGAYRLKGKSIDVLQPLDTKTAMKILRLLRRVKDEAQAELEAGE